MKRILKLNKQYIFSTVILLFIFVTLTILSILNPIVPLNSDEAWNYLKFARFGPIFSLTNFDYANFHIFFTFLQSFLVPKDLLIKFPSALRLLNTFVGTGFFAFLLFFSFNNFKKKYIYFFIISILVFLASPISTPFFILGRGYLLGMFLLILGNYFLASKKFYIASIFFILSGFTLPTYVYTFFLIYTGAFFLSDNKEKKKVIVSSIYVIAGLLICFSPTLKGLVGSSNSYSIFAPIEFFIKTLSSLSNFSTLTFGQVLSVMYFLVYVFSIRTVFNNKNNLILRNFIIFINLSVLSYYLVILFTSFFQINQPFLRNGVFVPIFVTITIFTALSFIKESKIKLFIGGVLLLNLLSGIYLFTTSFPHRQNLYPFFEGEQYYTFDKELEKIKQGDYKEIPLSQKNNVIFIYYSYLYPPEINSNSEQIQIKLESLRKQVDEEVMSKNIKKSEIPYFVIFVDNLVFPLNKVSEFVALKTLNFFDRSQKSSIEYLLYLADINYERASILWDENKYKEAIEVLAKAENYMTIAANYSKSLTDRKKKDDKLFEEAESSVLLHKPILTKMLSTNDSSELNILSAIVYFYTYNYNRLKLLSK